MGWIPSFGQPDRLWWLLLVPAIGILYILLSRRLITPVRRRTRLDRVVPRDKPWKRHISVTLSLLSLASLVIAYAQPEDFIDVPRERATVVLTLDVSRSMLAEDVAPNRLDAAKEAAAEFVDMVPQTFNVALVTFAAAPHIVVPPTLDRGSLKRAIAALEVAPSTATGEGIFSSLKALELAPPNPDNPDEPAPGAIVLLADGSTNMGRSSSSAAEAAKEAGVPVHTIAYGTPGGYLIEGGRRQPVPVDHSELARIASISGGKKFSAETKQDLTDVYEAIARSIGYEQVTAEVTERYAGFALLFALLAALGVISLAARWP